MIRLVKQPGSRLSRARVVGRWWLPDGGGHLLQDKAMAALKEPLRDKAVPSSANWETALKMIQKHSWLEELSKLQRKQAFKA